MNVSNKIGYQFLQKRGIWITTFLLFCCTNVFTQISSKNIIQVFAFSKIQYAGTIAIDENGKQLTPSSHKNYFVCIELPKKTPFNFHTIKIDNHLFSIEQKVVKQSNTFLGVKENSNNSVFLTSKNPNSSLYLISILNDKNVELLENKLLKFLLLGKSRNKKISLFFKIKIYEIQNQELAQ